MRISTLPELRVFAPQLGQQNVLNARKGRGFVEGYRRDGPAKFRGGGTECRGLMEQIAGSRGYVSITS